MTFQVGDIVELTPSYIKDLSTNYPSLNIDFSQLSYRVVETMNEPYVRLEILTSQNNKNVGRTLLSKVENLILQTNKTFEDCL
jgi:hypothetical protein